MRKTLWILFAVLAILTAIYPAIYFVIDRRFGLLGTKSQLLLANIYWNICFYTHIVFGGIALLIGWVQFNSSFRKKNLSLHRLIGKRYIICVLLSATGGMYIAFFATGGWLTTTAFLTLDLIWFYSTINAFVAIRKGHIAKHESSMIFSYAATFGAVTLRIWLPLTTLLLGNFFKAYPIAAWMAFVPNMMVAFYIVSKKRKYSRIKTAP